MTLSAHTTAWYWTAYGALRECIVTNANGVVTVLDRETLQPVTVDLEDVMVQEPDT